MLGEQPVVVVELVVVEAFVVGQLVVPLPATEEEVGAFLVAT